MKNKKLFTIIGIFLFIITILILFITTYKSSNLEIITTKDSVAYKYAKEKKLKVKTISESELINYKKNIETYAYNKNNSGIEITSYNGISKELIIPNEIDGYKVLSIHEGVFKDKDITKITLPKSIISISDEDYKDIKLVCYKTELCDHLKSLKDYDVTVLNDSDNYNFNLDKLEFEYNKDTTYELTKYNGTSKDIIVPDYINGYQVDKLTFEVDKNIKSIYIPKTVTQINLNILESPFNTLFWIILIFDALAIIVFIVINSIVSSKNLTESFNASPLRLISIIYIIFELIYSIIAKFGNYDIKGFILVSSIVLIVYILFTILLLASKKKIEEYDKKISNIDLFIKDTLNLIEDIDVTDYDKELVSEIEKINVLVKYSDPVSIDEVKEIEKEITKLIEKRNRIIKDNK